jgi:hypothetical protein
MTNNKKTTTKCEVLRKKIQIIAGYKAAATRARNKIAKAIKAKQILAGKKAAETRRKNKALREIACLK